jgi:long-chain fatty acid transport protein
MKERVGGLASVNLWCVLVAICAFGIAGTTGQAFAGGLYLNEFGTPSQGVAGAGAEAVASDASTAFHNPAGMTRLNRSQIMATGGLVYSSVKFDPDPSTPVPGGDGGDAGGPAPLLGAFYVHSLNERLKFGVNLMSISAAILDYDDSWTGRYFVRDVSIFTLALNPVVAYRITDWLSVGGGFTVLYGKLNMNVAVPTLPGRPDGNIELDGDDFQFGFNLGALTELGDRTRFGAIYWSKIEPNFGGDLEISPVGAKVDFDTKVPLPQMVRAALYHELSDQFALMGSIGWENWSELDTQIISTSMGAASLARNWEDTWKFAIGLHYRPVDKWLLQAGFAYDTSPTDKDDRTPDMPIDQQFRYAAGAQYEWSERLTVGGSLEYA